MSLLRSVSVGLFVGLALLFVLYRNHLPGGSHRLTPVSSSSRGQRPATTTMTVKKDNASLTIRPARESDIDRITEIAIAGFPYDPQWNYRYPHRKEFPAEHYRYVRLAYEEYWNRTQAGANQMMLTESPKDDDPSVTEVVSFSIWDNPGSKTAVPPVTNYFDRPDGDAARMHAYLDATTKARQKIFVRRYGPDQMSLRMMVTHPHYWRRGAGQLLVEFGLKLALEKNVAIVMFSSPMGKALYSAFGFKVLAKVHVQVEAEEEKLDDISCMAWEVGWTARSDI